MNYEYKTTIVYLSSTKLESIDVIPPDGVGWSLLSMVPCPLDSILFYTWGRQILPTDSTNVVSSVVKISCSDDDFERATEIVASVKPEEFDAAFSNYEKGLQSK